ncbi:MAG: S-methyl-5-thioribose-1-phosphate isomerase [Oscillospiraceae bacterium]|nr:S-methyl-5-thioribose-1-phosphate isomerase [Oscillospiraceae bacterium]
MEKRNLTNIRLSGDENSVIILDQRLLPNKIEYIELSEAADMYAAIKELKVRGAPALGIFAGFALYVLSKKAPPPKLKEYADYLVSARPTAVNLEWAVSRMMKADDLKKECYAIRDEDAAMCAAIAERGLGLLKDGDGVLTHCNAGPLATSRYGTGLGALILGAEKGMNFNVFVGETRPLLQGARITALELMNAGLDVTLICDGMASAVMRDKKIDAVFVGADRVAANGDVANKIGTSGLAVLAKHYKIPFYVFCPSSTVDLSRKSGGDIVIEERDGSEICELYFKERMAPEGVKCFNPAFDITDGNLITAIVTEEGFFKKVRANEKRGNHV